MLIHVTCPNCAEPYDIADTFAGGVYRCTKCNTLMSVPKPLLTPEALRTGPGMGKSPPPDEAENLSMSRTPGNASGSKAGSKAGGPGASRASASRKIQSVKGKGKGAPQKSLWDTYKMHCLVLGISVVVIGIVLAIVIKIRSAPEVVTNGVVVQTQRAQLAPPSYQFTYAQGVLTNAKPNVLGLPLIGNVAVVVDGASELNPARADLHKLLIGGLSGKPFDLKAGVVYGNGSASASPVSPIKDQAALTTFLGQVKLTDPDREAVDKGLIPALNAAIAGIPTNRTQQIVVVLGRRLTPYMQTKLVTAAEAAIGTYSTHLDVIAVDTDIRDLDSLGDLVARSHGKMVQVQSDAIHQAAAK